MRKIIVTLLAVCCFLLGLSAPVFAAETSYNLYMKYPFNNSMDSTALYEKLAGESPYVNPSKYTIPTCYFLSPKRISAIEATNILTLSSPGKRSFTYKSGYGGVGQFYCLSAFPGVTDDYDPYYVQGTWCR